MGEARFRRSATRSERRCASWDGPSNGSHRVDEVKRDASFPVRTTLALGMDVLGVEGKETHPDDVDPFQDRTDDPKIGIHPFPRTKKGRRRKTLPSFMDLLVRATSRSVGIENRMHVGSHPSHAQSFHDPRDGEGERQKRDGRKHRGGKGSIHAHGLDWEKIDPYETDSDARAMSKAAQERWMSNGAFPCRDRSLRRNSNLVRKDAFWISKEKRKTRCDAFFGVGAPEAVVVGAVALLVFGPQGLAQAAKSLGSALRSIAPTLRELQDVSTDFRTTLEKEIGVEDMTSLTSTASLLSDRSRRNTSVDLSDDASQDVDSIREETEGSTERQNGTDSKDTVETVALEDTMEEGLDIEEMRRRSQEMAWNASSSMQSGRDESKVVDEGFTVDEIQSEINRRKKLSSLSIEELEAELERQRTIQNASRSNEMHEE